MTKRSAPGVLPNTFAVGTLALVSSSALAQAGSAAAFVTNLSNKYYYQSYLDLRSFREGQMSAQPGEPREWGVTVGRKF